MLKEEHSNWQNFRQRSRLLAEMQCKLFFKTAFLPSLTLCSATQIPAAPWSPCFLSVPPLLPFVAGLALSRPPMPSSGRPSLTTLSEVHPQIRHYSLSEHCLFNSNRHQLKLFLCICLLGYFQSLPLNCKLPKPPCLLVARTS